MRDQQCRQQMCPLLSAGEMLIAVQFLAAEATILLSFSPVLPPNVFAVGGLDRYKDALAMAGLE